MNDALRQVLRATGVATRAELLAAVPAHVIKHATRHGSLARVFPRIYADPARMGDPVVRIGAALRYAAPDSVASHTTALWVWDLPGGQAVRPVHVSVARRHGLREAGVVVHQRARGGRSIVRRGLAVTTVERSIVDSWPLLGVDAGRAPVIEAVARRLTTPQRLLAAIDEVPNLRSRLPLIRLVHLLDAGCRSELELWGHDRIFAGPDMPTVEWQVPIRLGHRTAYLDAYARAAQVDFELDGARWHHSRADRERDVRRDAELAALGIVVVRLTYRRLVSSPDEVRAQIRAIVARRSRAFDAQGDENAPGVSLGA